MNAEFIDGSQEGELIEARGEVVRAGGSMVFSARPGHLGGRLLLSFSFHHRAAIRRRRNRPDDRPAHALSDFAGPAWMAQRKLAGVRHDRGIDMPMPDSRAAGLQALLGGRAPLDRTPVQRLARGADRGDDPGDQPDQAGLRRGDAAQLFAAEGGRGVHGAGGLGRRDVSTDSTKPWAGRRAKRPVARLARAPRTSSRSSSPCSAPGCSIRAAWKPFRWRAPSRP